MLAAPSRRSAVLVSRLLDRRRPAKVAAAFAVLVGLVLASSAGYVVREGGTLSRIAARSNTSVRALVEANDILDPDRIFVGREITIPTSTSTDSQSSPVESTHVIKRGETIRGVADAHGVGEGVVREANGIAGSEPIYTGNRLRLSMPYPLFIHS
jgi:LysM repeat protein